MQRQQFAQGKGAGGEQDILALDGDDPFDLR